MSKPRKIQLTAGIPQPKIPRWSSGNKKYYAILIPLFKSMKVGDSFPFREVFGFDFSTYHKRSVQARSVLEAASHHAEIAFSLRMTEEGGRVWRVER